MNLNNHGWGLKQMILYSAILLIALLCISIFGHQLEDGIGETFRKNLKGTITYSTIEEEIKAKTLSYIQKYYKEKIGTGTITITTNNLIKYQMLNELDLITSENDTCVGYALVRKEKEELIVEPFIHCNQYETKNYQSWRIEE